MAKKCISDEIDIVTTKKTKDEDCCWACGPVGEFQKVGDERYLIQAIYKDSSDQEIYEYIELCPKHLAFLTTLTLTHLMRVEKGKEQGPLNLPLLQEMQKEL
jgi:hypothetical protein